MRHEPIDPQLFISNRERLNRSSPPNLLAIVNANDILPTNGVGPTRSGVHDTSLAVQPMQAGWVMTVEPAIYLREEGFAVRLENIVLITKNGPVDLMAHVPIETREIEALMI